MPASARTPAPRRRYPPEQLVEALRGGAEVAVNRIGKSWGLAVAGEPRPLARFRSEKTAAAALEEARRLVAEALAACPPCKPALSGTPEERRRTRIVTPQVPAGEAARYEVREAAALVASHDPESFAPDIRYPPGVQERQYHADPSEARKVVVGAQNLDPALVLATTPSAVDGPPIVTTDGLALGGNGRLMMIRRAYREGFKTAGSYRAALTDRAAEFGQDPEAVAAMTAPILVRVVEGLSRESPKRELVTAVRRYNEGLTNAMDALAKAAAHGRQLDDNTVRAFGEMLLASPDGTLRELMRDKPGDFLRLLESDGIVTNSNRAEWITAGGGLSETAKDAVEAAFLGRVLGTADRLRATSPALLKKVERAVPHLVAIAGRNPAFSLIPELQAAVDLLNRATAQHLELEQLLAQSEMFSAGPAPTDAALALARMFDRLGQRAVAERFALWSRSADFDPKQRTMFVRPPSRDEAIAVLVGEPMRKANPASYAVVEVESSPKFDFYRVHYFEDLAAAERKARELAKRTGAPQEVRKVSPWELAEWPTVATVDAKGERVPNPRCTCPPGSDCTCTCACAAGKRRRNHCNGKCLSGRNDCSCSSCAGQCHGRGTCSCPGARRRNPGSSWAVHTWDAAGEAEAKKLLEQMRARADFLNGRVLKPGEAGVTNASSERWRVETYHKAPRGPLVAGAPAKAPKPRRASSSCKMGLKVAVLQDAEGHVRTGLVRDGRDGVQVVELLGVPEKTPLENAHDAARTIAGKLGLPLNEDSIVEVTTTRVLNPGPRSWVPIVRSKAQSVASLAGDVVARLKELPQKGAALVKASGLPGWLRLEFGARGIRRATLGGQAQPALAERLNAELKAAAQPVRAPRRRRGPKAKKKASQRALNPAAASLQSAPEGAMARSGTTARRGARRGTAPAKSRSAEVKLPRQLPPGIDREAYRRGLQVMVNRALETGKPYFPFGPPICDDDDA